MGLDLCVVGKPTLGYEAEWATCVRRSFNDQELSDAEIEQFEAITQPAHASLGAPRVGTDAIADDWIAAQMACRMSREDAITEYHGHYALKLIESDGLPKFSNAPLFDEIDETSYRGSFLEQCTLVLTQDMIKEAWNHRMPEEAVRYGQALLDAAADVRNGKILEPPKRSMFRALLGSMPDSLPLHEQLNIVDSAGRWFVFWGSRGHPIRAYF